MIKKSLYLFLALITVFSFSGCGDTNFFDWSHKEGSNKSVAALSSDADKAYRDGDYTKAETYYLEILAKDTDNSEAMYGMAQAAYGKSGVKLSKLISSFIEEDESVASSTLKEDLSILSSSKVGNNATDLIPADLDLEKLYLATNQAIQYLKMIALNQGDGVIPYNDPDVNINLAIAMVIHAALAVLDTNVDGVPAAADDLVSITQDYTITFPSDSELNTFKTGANFPTYKNNVKQAIIDIVGSTSASFVSPSVFANGATYYLGVALTSGNLPGTGVLQDLKDNFDKLSLDAGVSGSDLQDFWNKL